MAAGPADTVNLRWPPCPSFSKYKTERNVSANSLNFASDTERVSLSAMAIALFVVPKSMPTDIELFSRPRGSVQDACCFYSCAANQYANVRGAEAPKPVSWAKFPLRGDTGKPRAYRNPECARNRRIRTLEDADDDKTHGTTCSGMFQMK